MTCKLNTGDVTASGGIKNNVKGHYGNAQRTWRRRFTDSSSNIPEVKCSGGSRPSQPLRPGDPFHEGVSLLDRRRPAAPLKHLYSAASACHVASSTVAICIDVFTLSSVTLPSGRTVGDSYAFKRQQQVRNREAMLATNTRVPLILNYKNSTANQILSYM